MGVKMEQNEILKIQIVDNQDGTVQGQFQYNHKYFNNMKITKEILTNILSNISVEMIKNGILDRPIIH